MPVAEREQQARDRDGEPEPERPHVDEGASRDDQRAERNEDERRQIGGGAHCCLRPNCATGPPLNPNQSTAADEDARADQPEPDELRMRLRDAELAPNLLGAALLDPAGVFGDVRWGRFLRAMAGTSPRPASLLPPNAAVSIPKYVGASYDRSSARETLAERAVEHQHLPEAVRQRVLRPLPGPSPRARRAASAARRPARRRRTAGSAR